MSAFCASLLIFFGSAGLVLLLVVQVLLRVLSADTGANIGLGILGIASYVVIPLGVMVFIAGRLMQSKRKE
ncbi:hypothetical protein [Actinomyces culturomici]|uniref:hypothetical protein n=1 Tax=Actinomyces culturomici TaxID=1926276 RepID=UPI000E205756|nr:hypothetical protein [Actinomyces culturomici]